MQLLNSQKGVSHGELCIVSEEPTTAVVQCFSVLKPGGLFFFKDYGLGKEPMIVLFVHPASDGRSLTNEVDWSGKLKHQNVVNLLGYCVHDDTKFLIYEMMHQGSLESRLHGPSHGTALTWHRRMKITLDIARGLEYLHERCNPPVIHVDLKSANIFLDSNFNAKISDFGLATTELLAKNKVKLSGTSAYVAPEYLSDGKLTDKSDGYAFGVLLLELLIGRRPVEKMSPSLFHSFVTWAMPQLTDRSKLPKFADPVIRNTMDLKHLYQGVVAFWNRQSVRSFYIMHPHEVFKCAFKS